MKKLKAFWLRRSIATRLTALMALMLALVCALWTWFSIQRANDHIIQQRYSYLEYIQQFLLDKLELHVPDSDHLPLPDSESYWKLRFDYARWTSTNSSTPFILQYAVGNEIVSLTSPLTIIQTVSAHDAPVYHNVIIDLSDFSEADICSLQQCAQTVTPEWSGNSPYWTVYGTVKGLEEDEFSKITYLVANRIVSVVDGQTWHAQTPVEETTSQRLFFQNIFTDNNAMEQYFDALHFLQYWQREDRTQTGLDALQTRDFSSIVSGNGYSTLFLAYALDYTNEISLYFRYIPFLMALLYILVLFLFYQGVRWAVVYPLYDTTRQAQHVAHLEFDAFHPDTSRGDEIGDLNRALTDMAGDLHQRWDSERDLEDRRQQFVAAASHDLKTPLALIGGYAEAIAQDISPEENARYLAAIEQETGRMNSLVREMLDYTRLDRTNELEHRTAIDLSALLRSLLEEYAPLFEHRRLTLHLTDGIRIRGDETLLRRAFGCLLENAAKYSPEDGRVTVTLRRSGGPLFTVENDCEPIPESELPRLFEMFYRSDKARNRAGGHGLGLAITQKILALHGLACRAENTETGVCFIVTVR
ncbi:sensor histidine kinase [Agathobaculum sp. Marseille-P7918]|uniref:sensor histidine kinase n=1 Tax=Agathobaculum sp. Marseille-P7918 TaxID=2479843 RepID=UPI003568C60C